MLCLAAPQLVLAADAPPAGFDPNEAVTITPSVNPLRVDAGHEVTVEATVKNQTSRAFRFSATTHDSPIRRGGSPSFDFVPAGTTPHGLGRWLTVVPGSFVLQGGDERPVSVRVRVPDGTGAGEYFGGVAFLLTPLRAGGEISIKTEVTDVFLVTVGGEPKRDLRVDVRPVDRWAWRGGRTEWIVRISNRGDGHEVFGGQVQFAGTFGAAPTVRLRSGVLLPGEARSQRISAVVRDAPDMVVARVTVERTDGPKVQAKSVAMVVLPWWFLVIVLIAVMLAWWRLRGRAQRSSDGDGLPIAEA